MSEETLFQGVLAKVASAAWVAEQSGPVRRRVAPKLIKRGKESVCIIRPFEAERQA